MRCLRFLSRAFNRTTRGLTLLALVSTASLAWSGCESADAAFDCQAVCSRYRDCYNADYDVGACRERCRTASANNPSIRNDADTCEMCIGDKSCISATFTCGGSCGSIVF